MRAGEGHPSCPAWDGEPFSAYLRRFAGKLGLLQEDHPRLIKAWPKDGRSPEERIDAIFRGERDAEREPGVEG